LGLGVIVVRSALSHYWLGRLCRIIIFDDTTYANQRFSITCANDPHTLRIST
jgi:hypothetical protein